MIRGFLKEFKEFAFRGNMVDLAVGIIIGAAFGAVVNSLAKDVLMNVIAAFVGEPDYTKLVWHLGREGKVPYGTFVTEVVSFLMIAAALFFVVKGINRMMGSRDAKPEPPSKRECPYCRTSIPVAATRCAACTSEVEPASA
jgi:large conductance mechanosensitive channel